MHVLLHICCAPCSVMCIESLRQEGLAPTGYFYNPNIHPYTEYRSRRDALLSYADSVRLPLIAEEGYGLRDFLRGVGDGFDARCAFCYDLRLDAAAKYAAEHGFDAVCTTLLVSPYQNHALLQETLERAAQKYGVLPLYRDFRPYFREGQRRAREAGLYMQKYCGCIFSEEERYLGTKERSFSFQKEKDQKKANEGLSGIPPAK